ncbi:MAG: hypothetical protein A3I44_00265 [Candidatus Sungbacteria bacterium RIFCSPLOWO2_02_FULL_51_17]|uniref:AAA+ ATPase domain-containing protein n=1 Tax=Candidatus Sungbacteria bacterium RIFCSPHIGHO2_02_FULL_51_29 TaxID=1802273 RepID=A0A1G2KPX2_9BACT|nr:MAG: hypothetical protein A2676_04650 [Candidatus Sungbacteria bacterium RIFCSPHIGHO2_01_FULL_51_22]OHA01304.1 MAG: hypothetical protein A3C16_02050 [Candidatus Sungbacteria bacterium RIFCSPHIGHO2_02_FULL_51_29]OHA06467.1 MAG: hypothetical protein A3B29_05405 [Candidatus Sungbacteria bacterium RIFCSPLOWO2_01_FULL_51_34]OHA12529.1 MAG: hypothetical protein A3I44_00265 [Candidatus Sungbacteria bacterium RIFCSPLOWO2_02_FULL_51_17]
MAKTDKAVSPEESAITPPTFPAWYMTDLTTPFRAGISHMFLIHGNINDLVQNPEDTRAYVPLRKFFESALNEREMVIFYNIASGIRFLNPDSEKEFRKIAGLVNEDDPPKDPIAAARASVPGKKNIPREPDLCFPLIEKVMKAKPGSALVVNSVHFIAPAASGGVVLLPNERANVERLKNIAQDEEIRENKGIVILLTEELAKVSGELRQAGNEMQTVFIPKPDKPERRTFIVSLTKKSEEFREAESAVKKLALELEKARPRTARYQELEKKVRTAEEKAAELAPAFAVPETFNPYEFAHATQGMSLRQILEIFLHSKKTGKPIDLVYVKEKKREILNAEYEDVMELVDPQRGLEDIGGLEYAKTFCQNLLKAIERGEKRLVSMGVTFMGPPGTGKTALVEALAKEAGFNFVKTKSIRSMWVGESEARQQKLIYGLRSLAPVVVMNDEADLNDASRDAPKGDSGVSERMMKMWMELLSDPKIRGQIIVISCTNRPDRMDAALKRSGRSDERILIPMPSTKEIPAIFRVMFKRYNIATSITDFAPYAGMVEGFSGADDEKITLNAFRFAFEKGKKVVDDAILREAIEDFIPSASQAEIDRMTLYCLLECSSRRLLPPNTKEIVAGIKARNLVENLPFMLEQVKARNIADID